MPNKKAIPSSVKFPQSTLDKIDEASERTGLPKQEIIRLCTAIGLEDLRKLNWDLAGQLSDAAERRGHESRPKLQSVAESGNESSHSTHAHGAPVKYPAGGRRKKQG